MELTMSSAIWQVMVDAAIMGTLLLIGEFLRAKVKCLQKALIPPAVLAGVLALLLGPKVRGRYAGFSRCPVPLELTPAF